MDIDTKINLRKRKDVNQKLFFVPITMLLEGIHTRLRSDLPIKGMGMDSTNIWLQLFGSKDSISNDSIL